MTTLAPPLAPTLLLDGAASPVTNFLLVHHGLRRDLERLRTLLAAATPLPDVAALRDHWATFEAILTAHHQAEDRVLFPGLRATEPALGVHLDALDAEHGLLDVHLSAVRDGLDAVEDPAGRGRAAAAAHALARMVAGHLTAEEVHLVPTMLATPPDGPRPGGGFDPAVAVPWSLDGVADEVAQAVLLTLPDDVRAQVSGWRAAWLTTQRRIWGVGLHPGAATTTEPLDDRVA